MTPSPKKSSLEACLRRLPSARVLVIGDVMLDVFIWGRVRRISPEAPVPVVEVARQTSHLGGAANVVNNVLALGAPCSLAGVVGADRDGEAILAALAEAGAEFSAVIKGRSRPTAVKTRIIAHQQQVVRFDREEKRPLKPETVEKLWRAIQTRLNRADAVIVSDYAKGLIDARLMDRLIPACIKKGKVIAVDPKPENIGLYKGVTVITPNAAEAGRIAGFEISTDEDLERAGRAIIEKLGCASVLVTRGEKGMSLFRPGKKTVHEPARAREVFDVTGAGDTVIAVFTAALATGADMATAMKTANLAGAVVVAKVGTSTAAVEEIRAMAKNHGRK